MFYLFSGVNKWGLGYEAEVEFPKICSSLTLSFFIISSSLFFCVFFFFLLRVYCFVHEWGDLCCFSLSSPNCRFCKGWRSCVLQCGREEDVMLSLGLCAVMFCLIMLLSMSCFNGVLRCLIVGQQASKVARGAVALLLLWWLSCQEYGVCCGCDAVKLQPTLALQ